MREYIRGREIYLLFYWRENIKAYKLLRKLSDGKLYPLFIHKTYSTPFNEWMQAECYPTKGFAVRCGWHCTFRPVAPHLSMRLANGEQRVWVECEVDDFSTYNRPESQGGTWILAQRIKIIKELNDDDVMEILQNVA